MPKKNICLIPKVFLDFFQKTQVPKAPVSFCDSVGAFVCHRQTAPESGDEDRSLAAARRLRNNFSVSRLRRGGETVRSFPPGRLNFSGTQMSCSTLRFTPFGRSKRPNTGTLRVPRAAAGRLNFSETQMSCSTLRFTPFGRSKRPNTGTLRVSRAAAGRLNIHLTGRNRQMEVHAVWPFETAKHRDAASVSGRCGLAEL